MNEQEAEELLDILEIESSRQIGHKLTVGERVKVVAFDEKNTVAYNWIVDYVETWIRLDEENIEE